MGLFNNAPAPEIQAEAKAHAYEQARAVVGTFDDLDLAHEAAEELYKRKFEPLEVSIVADNLIFEGSFTGRFGSFAKAFERSGNGLTIGAVLGIGFGLTSFFTPVVSALSLAFYLTVFGAVVGTAVSLFDYMFVIRKRAFEAHNGVYSEGFSVLVPASRAVEAREALVK